MIVALKWLGVIVALLCWLVVVPLVETVRSAAALVGRLARPLRRGHAAPPAFRSRLPRA